MKLEEYHLNVMALIANDHFEECRSELVDDLGGDVIGNDRHGMVDFLLGTSESNMSRREIKVTTKTWIKYPF